VGLSFLSFDERADELLRNRAVRLEGMAPEIEAATALLETWDGKVEELAWAAELLEALGRREAIERNAVSEIVALAREVCRRARATSDAGEIAQLERAIARVS
jgi:hypothetical protein